MAKFFVLKFASVYERNLIKSQKEIGHYGKQFIFFCGPNKSSLFFYYFLNLPIKDHFQPSGSPLGDSATSL